MKSICLKCKYFGDVPTRYAPAEGFKFCHNRSRSAAVVEGLGNYIRLSEFNWALSNASIREGFPQECKTFEEQAK